MLQVRQDSDNYLMRSRRLLQQYACDQFAKIEGERLKFIALHQKEIRADKYKGLLDAVDSSDGTRAGNLQVIIAGREAS